MQSWELSEMANFIIDSLIDEFEKYETRLRRITVKINYKMRSCAGRAYEGRNRIELNPNLLCEHDNRGEAEETILHEIAHILAGCKNGHNHRWKEVCREIGGNAETYHYMPCRHLMRTF